VASEQARRSRYSVERRAAVMLEEDGRRRHAATSAWHIALPVTVHGTARYLRLAALPGSLSRHGVSRRAHSPDPRSKWSAAKMSRPSEARSGPQLPHSIQSDLSYIVPCIDARRVQRLLLPLSIIRGDSPLLGRGSVPFRRDVTVTL
jgi:hypothetical protein